MKLSAALVTPFLICGISFATFAHEAPVVDASQQQQMDSSASTQAAAPSTGSWQPVTTGTAAETSSADSTSAWRPVSAQPAAASSSDAQPQAQAQPVQSQPVQAETGSVDKRVSRLEQQMSNYNQMNLPQQVTDLQQKNAELQGQLEVAQHNLKKLSDQQKLYYQDLEQQLTQLEQQKPKAAAQLASKNTQDAAANPATGFVKKADIANSDTANTDSASTTAASSSQASSTPAKPASINLLNPKKAQMPSLSDADAYGKAFQSLSDKHFDLAQKQFHAYLADYPKGRFAMNAHFWLGEIGLMHEKYSEALQQFQIVVAQYPKSNRVSDAKLKIAMIHAATGKITLARNEFIQIRKNYPGSTAAQLASIRLQQLANVTSVSAE